MNILIASKSVDQAADFVEICNGLCLSSQILATRDEILANWRDFDLVLCTESLMDCSGIDACAALRTVDSEHQMPLVLIAPDDDFMVLARSAELGIRDVFDRHERNKLRSVLADHAESKAALGGLAGHIVHWIAPESESLEEQFVLLGLQSSQVHSAFDLHAVLSAGGVDLVVLAEFSGDGRNALDAIRQIRKSAKPMSSVPVVLVCSEHDQMLRASALRAGCSDTLSLPISTVELAARLGVHLRNTKLLVQVEQQGQSLQTMFDSLTLGIFEIDKNHVICSGYSRYLTRLLEKDDLAGVRFVDLVADRGSWDAETMDRVRDTLAVSLDSDLMNWELNEDELPRELTWQNCAGQNLTLEIEWSPIVDGDVLLRLLVILRDVTQIRALERARRSQAMEQDFLGLALRQGLGVLENFAQSSLLALKAVDFVDVHVDAVLRRDLHTIKGNARLLGLAQLSQIVHLLESALVDQPGQASELWRDLRLALESAGALAHKLSGLARGGPEFDNLGVHIDRIFSGLPVLAQNRGLENPICRFQGDRTLILGSHLQSVIDNSLTHLLNNALAHGLEPAFQRQDRGWSPQGTIDVEFTKSGSKLFFRVWDDGKGLSLDALASKFDPERVLDDAALAQKILESGVSTAQCVDELAGRGVGLDAVCAMVQQAGGNLSLELGPVRIPGHRSVVFELELPLA